MALIPTRAERQAFLRARQDGLGGSDIPAIAGLDPYSTPMDVYLDKVRDVDDAAEMNIDQFRGLVLEDMTAQLYAERTGREVVKVGQRAHPEHPWACVNVDREVRAPDLPIGALECKAPRARTLSRVLETGIPEAYIVQLQWELFITGAEWGSFAIGTVEHDAGPLITFDQEPNPLLIEQLFEMAEAFWREHVVERRPPHPNEWGRKPLEVPQLEDDELGTAQVLDPTALAIAHTLMDRYELRREVNAAYDEAAKAMREWLEQHGDYEKVDLPGAGRVTYGWSQGRVKVDHDRLARYAPLDPDAVARELRTVAARLRAQLADHDADAIRQLGPVLEAELVRGIPILTERAKLDLTMFVERGDAFRKFRPWPADDRAVPDEEDTDVEGG